MVGTSRVRGDQRRGVTDPLRRPPQPRLAPMITTRPAAAGDVDSVAALVNRAYAMYLPRMDREPAPMKDDYASLVADGRVAVAIDGDSGTVVGAIVRWI